MNKVDRHYHRVYSAMLIYLELPEKDRAIVDNVMDSILGRKPGAPWWFLGRNS